VKSGLRRLLNAGNKPPIPIGEPASRSRGLSYSLGAGKQDKETFLRQYGMSGTLYGIVGLLAEATATPEWHLYKKPPVDGRRRYSTGDTGSDQRVEIIDHAAIKLINNPNPFHSRFEFFEGAQQHQELTGETFWVLDMEAGFPTSMWYVRPDRMEPVPDPNEYLVGWIYTGPTGEQVPLKRSEVILEKRPDPMDPYRGAGPVQSIMPNIQQQRYATEYQRNLFLNGADPGGVITVPNHLSEREFDELIERWRESHRGVARAGHVGVLEDGMTWQPSSTTNKDMEYGNLRLANRDELREAWRIHKSMMGSSDDVNRANAETGEEVFVSWQVLPRLNRRRDTFNSKLLPLFGTTGKGSEFDFDDPSPVNAENASTELVAKSNAAKTLIDAGFDPDDVLEVVGLPGMDFATPAKPTPPETPALPGVAVPVDRESITLRNADASVTVFEQAAENFPPSATGWMHHAEWKGPVSVPLDHIDWTPGEMEDDGPDQVYEFVERLESGKKLKPVILVKTPKGSKLQLVDGHHRYLAAAQLGVPLRAFIGTVDSEHGAWEDMHSDQEYPVGNALTNVRKRSKKSVDYREADVPGRNCGTCAMFQAPHGCTLVKGVIYETDVCNAWVKEKAPVTDSVDLSSLLRRVLSDGYMPIELGGRS
jgi:HK97 family phage portal protein